MNNEVTPQMVQGIYKQAASDIIDRIKIALGLAEEKPEAIDAASAAATLGGGVLGGYAGSVLGERLGQNMAGDALFKKMDTLKDSMRMNNAASKAAARDFINLRHAFERRGMVNPSTANLQALSRAADLRTAGHVNKALERRLDRAMFRGGRMGKMVGAGAGALATAGLMYAATNPRTRAAIARMVDR